MNTHYFFIPGLEDVDSSYEIVNLWSLYYSFFKTLTNHTVTVELKNDIRIRGTLKSVDQYLNIKLDDIDVLDLDKYPHLSSVKNMFIRGSVVRYVVLPQAEIDRGLLEDATRRGKFCFAFWQKFPDCWYMCKENV
jgi:U6 snRNA-associated Sm-like protein LSm2